ncbi:MBL fold metallo-hydrolase [Engelhardtia mirabilis]|uniref:Putative polyketide biosynthesis zinc-dependent hydrolase BaeB n=1 Tax=Engelhardtia mirabilis TaxID=2528011 RepID=A0A518BI35_9BACT|nr:putative polyketide biosynthesis zinc-dependent hydrolase BaeB [Planctomycetes bacterium Pla133]QDV00958.1 putative polyketide biosynthesis zinc-dependent hydrolase BaeB [Planctomycetes bacterium Pla86]
MIVERSLDPRWLSNTWLVGDRPGGHGVLIDTGGPMEPILAAIEAHRLTVTHVLCTHHHHDHVTHNADYKQRFDCPICGHAAEAELFGDLDRELAAGEELRSGDLVLRALHIPGHTEGQLAFLVNESRVFTGDTLFKGSVGGTRAPGHGTFEELRESVMGTLMALPHGTLVNPGHVDETTIGAEWESNPFVRAWRGVDDLRDEPCTAFGQPARLLVEARDYDGGTKCQVRFEESGALDLVPGSRVKR